MRRIGLAVPLPVHAAWRGEPRVWRAAPSSGARGDDKIRSVRVWRRLAPADFVKMDRVLGGFSERFQAGEGEDTEFTTKMMIRRT